MFIPALSFVRLAGAVGAVRKLWFLLFNMGVAIAVGTVLGTATASLVFPRRRRRGRRGVAGAYKPRGDERESLRKVVAAAAAFGNMANLPLVLVSALCSGESARTVLFSSSPSGPPSRAQCSATAEEYVMAPIAVASVMQVGRRGFEGKGREREREKREREREKKRAKGALRRKKKGRKNSLFLCAHSVPSFCPQTHTNKNKQFMLAEAILRGKGQRKGREEATRPPSARAARTARGATTPASPPRGSSAELVPLRRVQEEDGYGEEVGEEEEERGAEKKQRAKAAASSLPPPRLPPSPFVANGSGKGKGPAPSPSSPPSPPPPLPPRLHAATRGDCVSIDVEPEEEEEEEEEAAAGGGGRGGDGEGGGGSGGGGGPGGRVGGGRLLTRSSGSKDFKAVSDGLEAAEGEKGEASPSSSSSSSSSHLRRVLSIATEAAAAAANPPAVAALVGLAVGSVPALRSLFFPAAPAGFAVLGSLSTAFETLGGAMIPCLMVVLGAELSAKKQEEEGAAAGATGEGGDHEEESSPPSRSLPAAAVAAALGARLVLMPCVGACFLFFCSRIGLLSPGKTSPPEPLFRLVALLAWGGWFLRFSLSPFSPSSEPSAAT